MMKSTIVLVTSVIFATVGGCDHSNANYCKGETNNDCRFAVDGPPKGCVATPSKCTGATAVCDMAADTCVECTAASAAACVGVAPVCGADHSCRGCTAHSECASAVCLPDGSCAAAADVAYVDGSTGAGTTCTLAAPCKTVTAAVATPKAVVKVTGAVNDQVSIGRAVKIFAAANGELRSLSNGPLLTTTGTAAVEVYDLTIADASGVNVGYGVQVGANTSFKLTRGKISGCREAGLTASGGTVTVTGATVSGNTGGGVVASGGTVTVTGATVSGNTGGGIFVNGSTFKIVNNFIFRNGDQDASAFGGVSLSFATAGANEFSFNTIADNRSQTGATRAGGVICDVATFNADNNVIVRNQNGASTTALTAQTLGACVYRTTRIQNDATGILFKSAELAPFDYHVLVGSTAIDAATTTSTVAVDIDGDARPQGAAKDQGADEYKP